MIVVDTSVWIDVLNGSETGPARTCIERADVPLLHADHDFDRLATCTALRIYRG